MIEWKDDDEFTTTYGTLKRSMVEAAEAERERRSMGARWCLVMISG
jgi:hypothetical protein